MILFQTCHQRPQPIADTVGASQLDFRTSITCHIENKAVSVAVHCRIEAKIAEPSPYFRCGMDKFAPPAKVCKCF